MQRNNIERCRKLRREQTDAEKKLWKLLRNCQMEGVKFRRQVSVGRYILDFYSPKYKFGIEADGGQHYEKKGERYDILRAKEMSKIGIEIMRFSNLEILHNIEGVYEMIRKRIGENSPSP